MANPTTFNLSNCFSSTMDNLLLANTNPVMSEVAKKQDLNYLHNWIPLPVSHDAELQGRVIQVWNKLLLQIAAQSENDNRANVDDKSMKIFHLLLRTESSIKIVVSKDEGMLYVSLRDRSSLLSKCQKLAIEHYAVDSPHSSFTNRFVDTSSILSHPSYPGKLLEIAYKIREAIETKQDSIKVCCLGYDRLFLKTVLRQLFPRLFCVILPQYSQLPGALYIGFKESSCLSDADMQMINKIERLIVTSRSGLTSRSDPHSNFHSNIQRTTPNNNNSNAPPLSIALDLSSSFNTQGTTPNNNNATSSNSAPDLRFSSNLQRTKPYNNSNAIILNQNARLERKLASMHMFVATYLAHILQCLGKDFFPQDKDADGWFQVWENFHRSPLILQSLAVHIQQCLYEQTEPLTFEQIKSLEKLASASSLTAFHGAFQRLEEDLRNKLEKSLVETCHYDLINLYLQFGKSTNRSTQKIFENLALKKCDIELASFSKLTPINFEKLSSITMEQVNRSYFPSDSPVPLASLWINGHPFEINSLNSDPAFRKTYYQKLIETLFFLLNKESIDGSVLAEKIMNSEDFPDSVSKNLGLMLRAASFSFWAYFHNPLQGKIVTPLIQLGYTVKFKGPQENPTCEFFVSSNQNFKTIRTGVYQIISQGLIKGEFVAKWIVSFEDNVLSCDAKIPMIDITDADDDQELEQILNGFVIPKSTR